MAPLQPLRDYAVIWYLRILQAVVTICVLGITGDASTNWHSWHCSTPPRLAFNIAAAGLALPAILYLLISSGPKASTHLLPWNRWAQLGLDGLFFTLWLATTIASPYNCQSLCAACPAIQGRANYHVRSGSLLCWCFKQADPALKARSDVLRVLEGRNNQQTAAATRIGETRGLDAAKQGLDAVMVVLFAITLALTLWRIISAMKARKAAMSTNGTVLEAAVYDRKVPVEQEPAKPAPAVMKL